MKASDIIKALRDAIPEISDRVGGAQDFDTINDTGKLQMPALYVIQEDDDIEISGLTGTLIGTDVYENFSIVLELDNTGDLLGYNAQEWVPVFRNALMSVLNNRWFDSDGKNLYFFNSAQGDSNQARYRWVYTFRREIIQKNYDPTTSPDCADLLKFFIDYNLADADPSTYPNEQDEVYPPQ